MPFYDNFSSMQPTPAGRRLAQTVAVNQLSLIIKHLADAKDILELGPGRGFFAEQCDARDLKYTCADISLQLLRGLPKAKQRILAYIPPLPLAAERFDASFAANLLEHMPDFRNAYEMVNEMRRVTKIGGLICHCVPNFMDWGLEFWNGDYTHSFPTTPRRLLQLYTDIGLHDVTIYHFSGPWIGAPAILGKAIGRLIPAFGGAPDSKWKKTLYSAKTTFLSSFMILGRK